jgi:hypothetical protein
MGVSNQKGFGAPFLFIRQKSGNIEIRQEDRRFLK